MKMDFCNKRLACFVVRKAHNIFEGTECIFTTGPTYLPVARGNKTFLVICHGKSYGKIEMNVSLLKKKEQPYC